MKVVPTLERIIQLRDYIWNNLIKKLLSQTNISFTLWNLFCSLWTTNIFECRSSQSLIVSILSCLRHLAVSCCQLLKFWDNAETKWVYCLSVAESRLLQWKTGKFFKLNLSQPLHLFALITRLIEEDELFSSNFLSLNKTLANELVHLSFLLLPPCFRANPSCVKCLNIEESVIPVSE